MNDKLTLEAITSVRPDPLPTVEPAINAALPITLSQLNKLIEDPEGDERYKVLYLSMFFGAMKVGDAVKLKWSCFSDEWDTLTRNDGMVVKLPNEVSDLISELYQTLEEPEEDSYIIRSSSSSGHISRQIVNRTIRNAGIRLGFPPSTISSESFRKGWAYHAVHLSGYTVEEAMRIVGAKSRERFVEYIAKR